MATLPNAERAVIPPRKITHYLLTNEPGKGKGKPGFFLRFGFTLAQWGILADALYEHARRHEVFEEITVEGGRKYNVVGPLVTPDGRNPIMFAVWQIDDGTDFPRFITARPVKGAQRGRI